MPAEAGVGNKPARRCGSRRGSRGGSAQAARSRGRRCTPRERPVSPRRRARHTQRRRDAIKWGVATVAAAPTKQGGRGGPPSRRGRGTRAARRGQTGCWRPRTWRWSHFGDGGAIFLAGRALVRGRGARKGCRRAGWGGGGARAQLPVPPPRERCNPQREVRRMLRDHPGSVPLRTRVSDRRGAEQEA